MSVHKWPFCPNSLLFYKISSSEYRIYACGKIFKTPRFSTKFLISEQTLCSVLMWREYFFSQVKHHLNNPLRYKYRPTIRQEVFFFQGFYLNLTAKFMYMGNGTKETTTEPLRRYFKGDHFYPCSIMKMMVIHFGCTARRSTQRFHFSQRPATIRSFSQAVPFSTSFYTIMISCMTHLRKKHPRDTLSPVSPNQETTRDHQ